MAKVNIYRSKEKQCDIVILEFGHYITSAAFEYAIRFLNSNLSNSIRVLYDPSDELVGPARDYDGIAIQLKGFLENKKTAKQEFEYLGNKLIELIYH